MFMMGLELMLNGVLLAIVGFCSFALAGAPEEQLLAIVIMAVMAVEMAIGFALVVEVYRKRQADQTRSLKTLIHGCCGHFTCGRYKLDHVSCPVASATKSGPGLESRAGST